MPFQEALFYYEEALKWLDYQARINALAYHAPSKLSSNALWRSGKVSDPTDQGWNALKGKFKKVPKP